MQSDIVTGVYEKCTLSPYPTGKGDGIVDKLVRMVGLVETQGIDHKHLHTLQVLHLCLVDGLHISDVGERGVG